MFEIHKYYFKGLNGPLMTKKYRFFFVQWGIRYLFSLSFCKNTYTGTGETFTVMHLLPSLQYSTP